MDPSYELKTDYARVSQSIQDALKRFANGCYLVWYPIIARPEAHQLPRRLKTLANQAGRPWLHASLSIGHAPEDSQGMRGLTASGMFVINPPHVLAEQLRQAQPWLVNTLGQGKGQGMQVETSE
jgi:23S rRNA (adenine2030-N6)-methyltransferase